MKARLSWLARVRWAIEQRAFELLAQPIVDLRGTSTDPMYEVLLRLRSDTGELSTCRANRSPSPGFGSFTYLKHFPFDFLKIDGEFVAGAMHCRADAVIVEAVRHRAHGLDRAVIAEHCSDAALVDFLRREGIDFAQGYHLGRPEPLEAVLRREPHGA